MGRWIFKIKLLNYLLQKPEVRVVKQLIVVFESEGLRRQDEYVTYTSFKIWGWVETFVVEFFNAFLQRKEVLLVLIYGSYQTTLMHFKTVSIVRYLSL